jgi:hypothetical protein
MSKINLQKGGDEWNLLISGIVFLVIIIGFTIYFVKLSKNKIIENFYSYSLPENKINIIIVSVVVSVIVFLIIIGYILSKYYN